MPQVVATSALNRYSDADPRYRLDILPCSRTLRVVFNDVPLAESNSALVAYETRRELVYYFPRTDVRMDLMLRTEHQTHCPFKGNAAYWTLAVADRVAENVAWSYEDPLEEALPLKNYIAFYWNRMDAWYEENEELVMHVPLESVSHPNKLVDWMLREAWEAASAGELFQRFARTLVEAGIPVWRLWITLRTLHPLLLSRAYSWQRGGSGVEEVEVPHGILQEARFLESPLKPIFEGAGGVRRRLDIPNPQLDYPVVREYHEKGATDYVAMPLVFSDGQINAISFTSDRPGGFSTDDLGNIYEILPVLSRLLEVHSMRRTSVSLLDTYLGKITGERVLNGLIKRGDGDDIYAVIWFCDLRESTPLAETMSREDFLGLLNNFFDTTAGAVLDHGGEVLRFIGDAALAIFPITEQRCEGGGLECNAEIACRNALAAAQDARARIAELNNTREQRGRQPLKFGLALHLGDVTYGNIGAVERLEFTVIGAAANEAARIEALCKTLDESILISDEFVHTYPGNYRSLGLHRLRGVSGSHEIFTLLD